ncbi:hypothetical protein LLEC1_06114, partial [Akanthomyces lecanii]
MDILKSILPPGKGILPYYMLILSVVSIGNSLQAYLTLHFSRRVYNGRFVPNPALLGKPSTDGRDPEDRTDKLVPARSPQDPGAAAQL